MEEYFRKLKTTNSPAFTPIYMVPIVFCVKGDERKAWVCVGQRGERETQIEKENAVRDSNVSKIEHVIDPKNSRIEVAL